MHADAWFTRGRGHSVCQDYARSGSDWVMISDGCSGSPDSDCGARLLVLAAMDGASMDEVLARAAAAAAGLLAPEALDATLLSVRCAADGRVTATAWGDGVIFGVRTDGSVEAWEIDQGGVPAYPAYRLHAGRQARYAAEGRGTLVRHWVGGEASGILQSPEISMTFEPDAWRLVGVASDGLTAFRGPDGPVPLPEVLAQVTDIRVPRGRFVERSSTFFLRRTCPRLGWVPTDDYSVAALWLGENP